MPRRRPRPPARRALLAGLLLLPLGCAAPVREPPARTAGRTVTRPPVPPAAAPVKVQPLGATYRVVRRAHLRRGPSTREPALAVLPVGTLVQATGRVEGADWLEVRYGRSRGFVQADLLRPTATGAGGDEAALPAEPAPSGAAAPGTEGAGP